MPAPPSIAGDVLRDRLANERTLLSWLRTAIALMGFGLVVARFGLFLKTMIAMQAASSAFAPSQQTDRSHLIGAGLLLIGSLTALVGWQRSRAYGRVIHPSGAGPSQRTLDLTVLAVAGLGFGLAAYVAILERVVR
jgi:putative membrane protein